MERPRDELLAAPGLAQNQGWAAGGGVVTTGLAGAAFTDILEVGPAAYPKYSTTNAVRKDTYMIIWKTSVTVLASVSAPVLALLINWPSLLCPIIF